MRQKAINHKLKPNNSNISVLIAEDTVATNMMFQHFLKSEFDGRIISVYDGSEAVNKCLKHQPALVFMDIIMPIKDGITAIREIRAAGFENPILVLTVYERTYDKECYEAGANCVVAKPFRRDQLVSLFKKYYAMELPT